MKQTLESMIEIAITKAVANAVVNTLFPGFVPYSAIITELLSFWEPKLVDNSSHKYYSRGQHAKIKSYLNYHRESRQSQNQLYYSRHRVR